MSHIEHVIGVVARGDVWKAVKYISATHIVRATRRLCGGKVRRGENIDIVLTIGRPNYAERQFIKDCKRAGEPFPIKKIQLRALPKKR